jgi:hypothetical protein
MGRELFRRLMGVHRPARRSKKSAWLMTAFSVSG